MECPNCQYEEIERSKRRGFVEKRIYSLFGFYPWRCVGCGWRFFIRARYKSSERSTQPEA
jgi:hypothetical protein